MPVSAGSRLSGGLPGKPPASERVRALDGLRAVAVLAVLVAHIGWYAAPGGYIGVDIFFVLSGFLITRLLVDEYCRAGRISIRRFYMRRALRLYPALWLSIAVAGVAGPLVGFHSFRGFLSDALYCVLYLMDFVLGFGGHPNGMSLGITWSLAIEEHFYLLWPLVIVFFLRRQTPLPTLARVAAAGAALSFLDMQLLVSQHHDLGTLYFRPDTRSGALLVGCAAALAADRMPKRMLRVTVWPALTGLLAIIQFGPHNDAAAAFRFAIPATWLCSAAVVVALAMRLDGWLDRALSWRPLVYVGEISYGIYLYQLTCLICIARLHLHLSQRLALQFVVPLLVASLSYHMIERPILNWKRRRFSAPGTLGTTGPKVEEEVRSVRRVGPAAARALATD